MNKKALAAIGLGAFGLTACSIPPIPKEPDYYSLPKVTTPVQPPSRCSFPVDNPTSVLSVQWTHGQFWNVYVNGVGPIGQVEAQTTSDAMSAAFDVEETQCTAQTFTPPEVTIPYGSDSSSTGSTGNTGNSGG